MQPNSNSSDKQAPGQDSPTRTHTSGHQTSSQNVPTRTRTSDHQTSSQTVPKLWLAVWLWIFLAIFFLGLGVPASRILTVIKIGGIFLCLWYTIQHFPHDHLLQAAFFATCIADVILAINNTAEIGIFVFLIAQIIHAVRLCGRDYLLQIVSFAALACVILGANLFWDFIPMIYGLCGFYIVALVMNIYISSRWLHRDPHDVHARCSLTGFILFLCCDSCTGLSFLALNHILPPVIYGIANFLAWFFYYPAQVLISNSSKKLSP